MSDQVTFDEEAVKRTVEELKGLNEYNSQNRAKFEGFITSELEPVWTTNNGKQSISELRKFLSSEYDEYVRYLGDATERLESIIPNLINMDEA